MTKQYKLEYLLSVALEHRRLINYDVNFNKNVPDSQIVQATIRRRKRNFVVGQECHGNMSIVHQLKRCIKKRKT